MFFLAQFVHRDLATWRPHLAAHMQWLHDQQEAGTVAASGPVTNRPDEVLAAMILLRAADEDAARTVLGTDPFMVHGVTEDLTMTGWNPFIGVFADETTPPPQLAELVGKTGP